ncbi:MAG: CRISPR-associated endonuclease Cas1 [Candidatus Asgardarchaeia archaeon]
MAKMVTLSGRRYLLGILKRRLILFRSKQREKTFFPNPDFIYVIHGDGVIDNRALLKLSNNGDGIIFHSERNRRRIRVLNQKNLLLMRIQVKHFIDKEKHCTLAGAFTYAALKNRLQMLHFLGKTIKKQTMILNFGIKNLERTIKRLNVQSKTASVEMLRNIIDEGDRIYISTVVNLIPTRYKFTGRRREFANDPVNITLYFGYFSLIKELSRTLYELGFHTEIGYLHNEPNNFDNLPLDIAEEFYQPVIDRIVFRLFIDEILSEDKHFKREGNHLYLNDDGKLLLSQIINSEMKRFRPIFMEQAIKLRDHLFGKSTYSPYIWDNPEEVHK